MVNKQFQLRQEVRSGPVRVRVGPREDPIGIESIGAAYNLWIDYIHF